MMKKRKWLLKFINFYPPFFGAGIKVYFNSPDLTSVKVRMKLKFWNKNYVYVHFGGSIYAMCDPFYMLILMQNLGDDYIIWDKSSKIDFLKPGRGTLFADFTISKTELDNIRKEVVKKKKINKIFFCEVKDDKGVIIAKVEKLIYIRKKGRLKIFD